MPEMNVMLRKCRPDEIRTFMATCEVAFGFDVTDEQAARWSRLLDPDRTVTAFDGDEIVGTAADFQFTLTVPGGKVAAAGVTAVGVLPSHRRLGILRDMMRQQLDDVRARSEPIAVLWASEGGIYDRFGYGIASLCSKIDIDRDRARFRGSPTPVGRTRLLADDKAIDVLAGVYDRVCEETPGMYERTRDWWEAHRLADPEAERHGGGPMFKAVWELDGRAEAYALYRVHQKWDTEPMGYVQVLETMGTSPLAIREMWRFLIGIDLVARIKGGFEPAIHPLQFMLAEPRRLRARLNDGLWIRIVDIQGALQSRSYAEEGTIIFDVSDELLPDNARRWRLTSAESTATVEPTEDEADLRVTIGGLGSVYLGGFSFADVAQGGDVQELKVGAIGHADRLFRTDRQPWSPEIF
jgi:predicted acetyltransferase